MENLVEIFCDASIRNYENGRRFGCAGAICPELRLEKIQVLPDSTNNRSELTAVYLAVKLAKKIKDETGRDSIIYSDSKLCVQSLKEWIPIWLKMRHNGILFNSQGKPVKNQDIMLSIINYIVSNKFTVYLRHQKGHVNINDEKSISNASMVFYQSNGYCLELHNLIRISNYNNEIDERTRNILKNVDEDKYPLVVRNNTVIMCYFTPPDNYIDFIK